MMPAAMSGPVPEGVRAAARRRIQALQSQIDLLQGERQALALLAVAQAWPDAELPDQLARAYLATGSCTEVAKLAKAGGGWLPGRREALRVVMPLDVQLMVAGRPGDLPQPVAPGLREVLQRRRAAAGRRYQE